MKKTRQKDGSHEYKRQSRDFAFEEYICEEEPFYLPVANEVEIFEAAHSKRLPILLKGPTGCGKTRFLEYMSHRLGPLPLITVACHEDLTATDLVGRYLLEADETRWLDGPLTRAVKAGAICYLDEIVEARKDTTVLIHPLSDHRRILPIERLGQVIEAHENFQLVISYNPGYQTVLKDLKPSTRQRFVAIEFDYPSDEIERNIVHRESGVARRHCRAIGAPCGQSAQPARARPAGRRQHATACIHRTTHRLGPHATGRLPLRFCRGSHRRSRS